RLQSRPFNLPQHDCPQPVQPSLIHLPSPWRRKDMTIGAATRIAATFERTRAEGRPALIAYLIPGFPTIEAAPEVFDAVVAAGAPDRLEVGLPFSDPLADGATHQRAAFQAITNGMDTKGCLEFAAAARKRHPDVPIIFMGYLNLFLAHGIERFAADAEAAGAD